MLFRISRQRKIIANGNFEHSFPSEYLLMGVKEKGCLSRPEISEYCFYTPTFTCSLINTIPTSKCAWNPDCRSDSIFPGSRYAMLMRNPGPVNAHSLRKENPY